MRWIGAGAVVVGVLVLAACSPATATSAEVQTWLAERSVASDHGLASASALALKASEIADDTLEDLGEQIRIDFDAPVNIDDVEFSCFGAATMDLSLYLEAGPNHIGTGATDVRCEDGAISIDVAGNDERVSAVRALGVNDAGAGAWSVTIR